MRALQVTVFFPREWFHRAVVSWLKDKVWPFETLNFLTTGTNNGTEISAGYYFAETFMEAEKPEAEISFSKIAFILTNLGLVCSAEDEFRSDWLCMPMLGDRFWAFGNMDGSWAGNLSDKDGMELAFISFENIRTGETDEVKIARAIALCFWGAH